MKWSKPYLLAFWTVFMLSSLMPIPQQVDGWMLQRERKGIKVFTRKSRWSRLKDSQATMFIPDATPDQIRKLLSDFDRYPDWVPHCSKAKKLANISENEFIAYMKFKAPWPVRDRDCVVRIRIDEDIKTGTVTVREVSEPKYLKCADDCVRIEQMYSNWKIVPKEGGVEVMNEYSTNPGGDLPEWMVNTQSVENPFETFTKMKEFIPIKK